MIGLLANYGILIISGLALIGISVGANYAHSNDVVAQNVASPKAEVVATANAPVGGGTHSVSAATAPARTEPSVQSQTPPPQVTTTVEAAVTPPPPAPVVHTTTTSSTAVQHTTVTLPTGVSTRNHRERSGDDD